MEFISCPSSWPNYIQKTSLSSSWFQGLDFNLWVLSSHKHPCHSGYKDSWPWRSWHWEEVVGAMNRVGEHNDQLWVNLTWFIIWQSYPTSCKLQKRVSFLPGRFPSRFSAQPAHQPLFHSKAVNVLMHPLSAHEPIAPLDVKHLKAQDHQLYLYTFGCICRFFYIQSLTGREQTHHGYV